MDPKLCTHLGALTLRNPIIPASGTFGFGREFCELFDLNRLGGIAVKGTTQEPRPGNPLPRIAETTGGMLNSVGLQNPGIDQVLKNELPWLRSRFSGVIFANISGFSEEEYVHCCELADASPDTDAIELNISCPNVHGGGMSFGSDPKAAARITKAVRAVCRKPLFVKLTPNVTDITEIACACEHAGADGLSLINTLLGMRIDPKLRRPILANETGGLSGPAIFPIALRMVWQVYRSVQIPIIGIGGISSAVDVIEMMLAGASAVQVGAASLVRPTACCDIIDALPAEMSRLGIDTLESIIGGAH